MLETIAAIVIVDGTLHMIWSIIEDRVPPIRRLVFKDTINESTKMLIRELKRKGRSVSLDKRQNKWRFRGTKVSVQPTDQREIEED